MASGLWRSLVFWSGLLVMGFIVWAWWDSTRQVSFLRSERWELQNWASGVSVAGGDQRGYGWSVERSSAPVGRHVVFTPRGEHAISIEFEDMDPGLRKMRFARAGLIAATGGDEQRAEFLRKLKEPAFDAALRERARRTVLDYSYAFPVYRGGWVLFIPHWLILLAVAVPWICLLVWRRRRMRRHERMLTTMDAVIP